LALFLITAAMFSLTVRADEVQPRFIRVATQFIAALGDPDASAGSGAERWGVWRQDPGPRGVWLDDYAQLKAANGLAPAKWQFDDQDWWVEENGLIMEKPDFPLPPGKYMVTGDREAVSVLTIYPDDENGGRRWHLGQDATLFDVTHLPCRSARYSPASAETACSPALAQSNLFPLMPGAIMPAVAGCKKQDYAVLFIIAVAMSNL
jgi:hypothetical protein